MKLVAIENGSSEEEILTEETRILGRNIKITINFISHQAKMNLV
jgi:hypothetical protein